MKFSVEEVEAELDAQVTNDSNNTASTSTPSDPVVNNHPLQNDFEQFCESYYAASSSKPNKATTRSRRKEYFEKAEIIPISRPPKSYVEYIREKNVQPNEVIFGHISDIPIFQIQSDRDFFKAFEVSKIFRQPLDVVTYTRNMLPNLETCDINEVYSGLFESQKWSIPARTTDSHSSCNHKIEQLKASLMEKIETVVKREMESAKLTLREEILNEFDDIDKVDKVIKMDKVPILHSAICDQCDLKIIGVRYKCAFCSDYDLCESCEKKNTHDPNHFFLKITHPIDYYINMKVEKIPKAPEQMQTQQFESSENAFEGPVIKVLEKMYKRDDRSVKKDEKLSKKIERAVKKEEKALKYVEKVVKNDKSAKSRDNLDDLLLIMSRLSKAPSFPLQVSMYLYANSTRFNICAQNALDKCPTLKGKPGQIVRVRVVVTNEDNFTWTQIGLKSINISNPEMFDKVDVKPASSIYSHTKKIFKLYPRAPREKNTVYHCTWRLGSQEQMFGPEIMFRLVCEESAHHSRISIGHGSTVKSDHYVPKGIKYWDGTKWDAETPIMINIVPENQPRANVDDSENDPIEDMLESTLNFTANALSAAINASKSVFSIMKQSGIVPLPVPIETCQNNFAAASAQPPHLINSENVATPEKFATNENVTTLESARSSEKVTNPETVATLENVAAPEKVATQEKADTFEKAIAQERLKDDGSVIYMAPAPKYKFKMMGCHAFDLTNDARQGESNEDVAEQETMSNVPQPISVASIYPALAQPTESLADKNDESAPTVENDDALEVASEKDSNVALLGSTMTGLSLDKVDLLVDAPEIPKPCFEYQQYPVFYRSPSAFSSIGSSMTNLSLDKTESVKTNVEDDKMDSFFNDPFRCPTPSSSETSSYEMVMTDDFDFEDDKTAEEVKPASSVQCLPLMTASSSSMYSSLTQESWEKTGPADNEPEKNELHPIDLSIQPDVILPGEGEATASLTAALADIEAEEKNEKLEQPIAELELPPKKVTEKAENVASLNPKEDPILGLLSDMGFTNLQKNKQLISKYSYDLNLIVNHLLGDQN